MAHINPSLPIADGTQPNSTEEPKIPTAISQVVSALNNLEADNVDPTFAAGNMEPVFSAWRTIIRAGGQLNAAGPGSYFLGTGARLSAVTLPMSPSYLAMDDPADYAAGARIVQVRMRTALFVNSVASTRDFTVAAGCHGQVNNGNVTGSGAVDLSVFYPAPPANAAPNVQVTSPITHPATSMDFGGPTLCPWLFRLTPSAGMAASSRVMVLAELQVRQA